MVDEESRELELSKHFGFMRDCLDVAQDALEHKEVPVACIYVYMGEIIAKSYNQTNVTLNGTKHAEFEGFDQIRRKYPDNYLKIISETDLYVTVEPCIMCASMLRQIKIRRCFFGCANDRFGGNGSVFTINKDFPTNLTSNELLPKPYLSYPGILNREAIILLRKFYMMENENSPAPRDKKERKLELNEFPKLIYSNYLTKQEFIDMFGEEREHIYDENGQLEEGGNNGTVKHYIPSLKESDIKKQKI